MWDEKTMTENKAEAKVQYTEDTDTRLEYSFPMPRAGIEHLAKLEKVLSILSLLASIFAFSAYFIMVGISPSGVPDSLLFGGIGSAFLFVTTLHGKGSLVGETRAIDIDTIKGVLIETITKRYARKNIEQSETKRTTNALDPLLHAKVSEIGGVAWVSTSGVTLYCGNKSEADKILSRVSRFLHGKK
jgi:hypothetical protein